MRGASRAIPASASLQGGRRLGFSTARGKDPLGARLVAPDGGIAALFTDAVRSESRGLALGASRRWSLPAGAKNVQATLRASAVRRETLTALGLPGEEAPVLEIEHAPRH